jgi:hypothetical protein
VLVAGALLAPGNRPATAALRVMGWSQEKQFQQYHRALNRARGASLAVARVLWGVLIRTFVPVGPGVIGLDDTLERRRGGELKAKGISRDPVRPSRSHVVKASGLRWLCAMVVVEVGWAARIWALPFLTALCPSERSHRQRGQRHKKLPEWARQMSVLVRRWLPGRDVVFGADSTYAVLALLKHVSALSRVSLITRLRLDAALYGPAPQRQPGQNGRPRLKGARRPTLEQGLADPETRWTKLTISHWYGGQERAVEVCTAPAVWYHTGLAPGALRWVLIRDPQGEVDPQALLSTEPAHTPGQMWEWFVRRWAMEVAPEEARAHLGIETPRQWHELAIARTTPTLLGLYSLVTVRAQTRRKSEARVVRTSAWYVKAPPTFSDAIALARRELWSHCHFSMSRAKPEVVGIPRSLLERLTDAVCYAA